MKKAIGVWKWTAFLAPILSFFLIITVTISAYVEAQREIAALLVLRNEFVLLNFDGTYDDREINLHIWSEQTPSYTGDFESNVVKWVDDTVALKRYGYKVFENPPAPESKCPICYPGSGDGWNCIGFSWAAWHHGGGIESTCNNYVIPNNDGDMLYGMSETEGSAFVSSRAGVSCTVIKNGGSGIPESMLRPGDIILMYSGSSYYHSAIYLGNNRYGESSHPGALVSNDGVYSSVESDVKVAIRYSGSTSGGSGSSNKNKTNTSGYTKKDDATVLRYIGPSTGSRHAIGKVNGTSANCAQSFAYVNGVYAVAYVTTNHPPGYVQIVDRTGKKQGNVRCDDILHANAACATHDGKFLVTGKLGGDRTSANLFNINGDKVSSSGARSIPVGASSAAYDKETRTYCFKVWNKIHLYDQNFNEKGTVVATHHENGTFFQDIGAGGGYIFACFTSTGSRDSETDGTNYIDVYSEATGDYCGTYNVTYGELESCDVVDGELVLLVHISGNSNYIHNTGIKVGSALSSQSYKIDFTVSASKAKIGNAWQLSKNGISYGAGTGSLNATAIINSKTIAIDGRLFGGRLRLRGNASKGKVKGKGWVEKTFESTAATNDEAAGSATYVGVDDKDTDHSRSLAGVLSRWYNAPNPFYSGYGGLCEAWVCDVYKEAGLPVNGQCCAYTHCAKEAHTAGAIPKGALIFSGKRRDGTMYENGHRASAYCDVCDHWAGHVAIYIGNGLVAGSQVPYIMSVDAWIDVYGYGGWSLK